MKNKIILILFMATMISCEKENLSELNNTLYIRRNGADMPAYIYGNASEKVFLIILHGGPGGSGLIYRSFNACQSLENECAVVYWDQRGQGMSQGHYSSSENTVEEMAKDVRALALVLKNKYGQDSKLFLLGHSWGGTIGTKVMVTEDYQYLFNGWIELDGCHDYSAQYTECIKQLIKIGDEQIALGNSVDYWESTLNEINELDTLKYDGVFELNNTAYTAESVLMNDGMINQGNESLSRSRLYYYMYENRITSNVTGSFTSSDLQENDHLYYEYSLTDELYRIEIPSLFIWGMYDMVVPPELGRSAYSKVSSQTKKLVILERSGHQSIANQPDEIVNEIVEFINDNK